MPDDPDKPESPIWRTLHDEKLLRDQYDELAALAGSLAHEIKNPLSVIRMNMELLNEDFQQADSPQVRRARERIETINRQCVRLENLLDDFLRFARQQNLELRPGNLNDQIHQVLDLFSPQADRQGVEVLRYLASDLPLIRLDSQSLQAALVNLVKNALEAMPNGGQLLVRTRITRQGVAVDLIDTGCGMSSKTILNMFKTFYTNKPGGSGLGLPMAKKIIEAHGGRINVNSEVGRGTQFTLEFPTPRRL
ncbi:MAG TPA: ATP-binding protein [Pirellulaceae bacterium]|nr:ATP-binding protein [Pirellulaceae bacterium]